ncbi:MAG: phage tail tape measure protein [Bacteroidetes bacterium]|nr:phage tail tape measure protein [Bacteroidota bacterium]
MSGRSENIRFNVYLNDKQAGNTMGQLHKQSRILRSELGKLKIGSQAWIAKMKQLQKVEKDLGRVRNEIRGTNSTFGKMAQGFNKYSMIIMAGIAGIASAVYGLRKSMNTLVEFEKTMANVLTLLSDQQKLEFREYLKKGSIQIVKEYGFAVADTNKALFDAISAGVEAGNSIEFLDEASILAIGGVTDLSTSVDGLTTIINAFKLETDDAADISAAFFSAQKEGKTTVAELASNIGTAAPLAHTLGIRYQELMSAAAALTKGGIKTDKAFTFLRGTFTNLIKPSNDLSKLFQKEFGHGMNAGIVKTMGFTKVLSELDILLQKYPNELQASIENVRALSAVTALSGKGFEEYQRILQNVQGDIGKNNSLLKAFAEQEDTLSQHLEKAKGNLVAMTISLVEGFRPAIFGITKIVSKFSHAMLNFGLWMKENSDTVKFFAKAMVVLLTSIATYKMVVAAANAKVNIMIKLTGLMQNIALRSAIAYNKLTGNIGRAAAAQRVLNNTVRANPLGLILGLLASAGAAYLAFRDKVKEATAEEERFNEELERQKELLGENTDIEERAKVMDSMTEGQMRRFKRELEGQLTAIDEINEKKLLAAENYKKEVDKLSKKYANEDPETKAALFANKYVTEARDKALAELNRLHELEQTLNADRLNELKAIIDKKLEAFAGGGSGEDEGSLTDEEIEKMASLNEKINDLARSQELGKMEQNKREIEMIRDKYQKLIDEAVGYDEQIKRLGELRDADIKLKEGEQKDSYVKKRAEVIQKVKELGYTDREEELAANQQTFDDLIAMAELYGLDTAALLEQQKINEQFIKDKYNQAEIKANDKKNKDLLRSNQQATQASLSVMGNTVSAMSALMGEQSEEFKALAYFQTAINTAAAAMAAYNSVVGTPYVGPILAPIAAAAAIAMGVAQMAAIKSEGYGSYAKGGIARGASHAEGGIHMIDSKTGKKVGEMEGDEPYMILSTETYKNNRELVDSLLDSSLNRGGEQVDWMQPGYYPHPDVGGTVANLRTSRYATGAVTNVNNVYQQQQAGSAPVSNAELVTVMTEVRDAVNNLKFLKAILDLDGTIQLKKALAEMETLESEAGL